MNEIQKDVIVKSIDWLKQDIDLKKAELKRLEEKREAVLKEVNQKLSQLTSLEEGLN